MKILHVVLLVAVIFSAACNASRVIKPLEKGEWRAGFNLGGPLLKLNDAAAPVPLSSFHGAYGVHKNISLYTGWHLTTMLTGLFQMDAGATFRVLEQKNFRPGIVISPTVNFMVDTWKGNARVFPQADVNFYWNYLKKQNYFYAGMGNWFDLSNNAVNPQAQYHWIPFFNLGHQFERKKMSYQIELKYIAPFNKSNKSVVEYVGPGNQGGIGIYLGLCRKF